MLSLGHPDPESMTANHTRREIQINAVKMMSIVLLLGGVLGLAYGSFTYTKETHSSKIGPIELSVRDTRTVNIPVWAGAGAIMLGGALLLFGRRRS
jgi:LPXTG-motif cell wall-anchored protein